MKSKKEQNMRTFYILPTLAAGALMGCMLVFPREAAGAALAALTVFARSVLPALLPFSVCAQLLTAGHSISADLLCLLALPGGSPTGARLFAQAPLSPAEARRCAVLTGTLSPMFFLSTLSDWLDDPRKGAGLLAVHLLSALLCGLFFRHKPQGRIALPPVTIPQALAQSAQAMLTVAGAIVLGAVAARMLRCALPLPPGMAAVLHAFLEVTGGCHALITLALPLPLLAALLSFGGLSLLLQNAAFWQQKGLGVAALAALALPRAAIAFLLCAVLVQTGIL